MSLVLHALLGWPLVVLLLVLLLITIIVLKNHPSILMGISLLFQSPSGVFGLLTLLAITLVSWIQPTIGGMALAAFAAAVPAILAWVEHKETLLQMTQSGIQGGFQPAPPLPPVPDPSATPLAPTTSPDPLFTQDINSAKPVIGSPDAPIA